MDRYRYNVRNKDGVQEIYTGIFKCIKEAQQWYERYGTYFVSLGRELLLIKLKDNEKTMNNIMKTKYKYLGMALLGNLILFGIAWYSLANMFILKHDESAFFIAFFIYGIKSIDDTKVDELKDKVEELEKRKKIDDKFKQFLV